MRVQLRAEPYQVLRWGRTKPASFATQSSNGGSTTAMIAMSSCEVLLPIHSEPARHLNTTQQQHGPFL
jgi:hypothetical protein